MSILKELREMFKIGFLSDSAVKKFLHESGISPEREYQKEIAENTSKLRLETEESVEEMKKLRKALEQLADVVKDK